MKFAKYLPEFGWDPTILTAKPVGAWVTDDSLLDQVNCSIVGTKSFHPVGKYRSWKDKNPQASPILRKCLWWLCERLPDKAMIPDTRSGWVPHAIAEGLRLHRKQPYDLILTNSPPHSSHAIGLALKKLTGLPWVADFKDGWMEDPFRPRRSEWRNALESLMERSVAQQADHLVTISDPLADYFSTLSANPVTVIPNGYDEEDFASLSSVKTDRFTIGYFGSIFGDRDPTNFLRGMKESLSKVAGRNPRLLFVGPVETHARNKINSFPELDVEIIPYLPHRECLTLMKNCHALLTLVGSDPKNKGVLTGKIFEYLRSGVPIISLCPKDGA
ncbi:MAG: glycosyltransferase, partial [Opitutales bacterium]